MAEQAPLREAERDNYAFFLYLNVQLPVSTLPHRN
jgi:hypothetical protein